MSKLNKKLEESKQAAEAGISESVSLMHTEQNRDRALMMFGAVGAINHIAKSLSAQTIRGLQKMREEKIFEAFGFTRFDDFLDGYENSPMSYRQFYDREKLLEKEGDELFDVLNDLRMSHRARKLLGSGNVALEGNTVIVKTMNDDGDEIEEEIQIDDKTRLLQTLSALADQNANLNRKTDRQKTLIDKKDSQIEELSERIQRGAGVSTGGVHIEYFMRSLSALTSLKNFIKNEMTLVEKERDGEMFLREIYAEFALIRQELGKNDLRFDEVLDTTGEFAGITSAMNDDELAGLME